MRPNVHNAPYTNAENISLKGVAVVIPARMAASRLPNKPLAMIGDAPMIVHVMRRAHEAGFGASCGGGRVIIACDDQAIADAVIAHGGEAILTDPRHPSGSDRVHEAITAIDPLGAIDIVVNLQGDLPDIDGDILRPLVAAARAEGADITTPIALATAEDITRDQVVKAVVSFNDKPRIGMPALGSVGRVLYFSRYPVPHGGAVGGGVDAPIWHHIGIYAWKRAALTRFVGLPPSPLEKAEKLEQLRALEDGMMITALVVDSAVGGIDTPEDLTEVRKRMAE